jgi:hypothetical protein
MKKLILLALLFASCSKDSICGEVTGGGVNRFTGELYLEVDGQREWVDMKTYESFYIGDPICLD